MGTNRHGLHVVTCIGRHGRHGRGDQKEVARAGRTGYNRATMAGVLIIDDEEEMCTSLAEILEGAGHRVSYTVDPGRVPSMVAGDRLDVVLMDIRMPDLNGIDLLGRLRAEGFDGHVIMVSGYPSVENIVRSMKAGATNFYRKPLDVPSLLSELETIAAARETRQEPVGPERGHRGRGTRRPMANDPVMRGVLDAARKAAPTDAPVLLIGETGSGKELIAESIVAASARRDASFLKLNCAAVPDSLLEGELFGHEAGAFTDAREKQRGKLELADGGTLFLDEVGEMSLSTQAKLLRVLQEWEFHRLGGTKTISVDVRVIAATNCDLGERMRDGRFREDLYYRLAVVELQVPALRSHRGDIIPLAEHFLHEFAARYRKPARRFAREVSRVLLAHDWPGNVRELRNIVERSIIFCDGETIELDHLPENYRSEEPQELTESEGLAEAGEALTRQMILNALRECNGVKRRAAERLHIHRKTLYNRMKKLGIQ
ncbi:MAG: sigma-54-dependent transcriptional regulator [Spirochaetaceae bacterium]